MSDISIAKNINNKNDRLLYNERLDKYTSWRVGGCADHLYFPANRESLINFLKNILNNEPIFWMGMGSNLLIRDGGIRGTVINTRGCLKEMYLEANNSIYVEAGVRCSKVARFCADNGFTGAEFLAGIPGTIGGALKMNAGAFGSETWGIVASIDTVNLQGVSCTRKASDFKISYRNVEGLKKEWFLAANLRLTTNTTKSSQRKIKELLVKRARTQPINLLSCGSVFKNPKGDFAARLIEASGLKNYSIGDAYVAEKHANFIINKGCASANDIETLIVYVQQQVALQQGVNLQTEVCIVGECL